MNKLIFVLMFGFGFGQKTQMELGTYIEVTTRAYDLELSWTGEETIILDFFELTGYNLDFAHISVVKISNYNTNTKYDSKVYMEQLYTDPNGNEDWNSGGLVFELNVSGGKQYYDAIAIYDGTNQVRFRHDTASINCSSSANVTLLITAPFSDVDLNSSDYDEKLLKSSIPNSVYLAVENYRKKYPAYENVSYHAIYKIIKREQPHLEWKEVDEGKHIITDEDE